MFEYEALRIRLLPGEEGTYRVIASGPLGDVSGDFRLPFEGAELENFILRIGRPPRGVRKLGSPEMTAAQKLGSELFDALFRGNLRDLYHAASAQADAAGKGMRITLLLGETPDLMHVPWEYMCDDGRFLSVSERTPIVRYLDLKKAHKPLPIEGPLRIIGMVSSPTDVAELDVEAEKRRLDEALERPISRGEVELVWLDDATLSALHEALEQGPFHILHFIGHGAFDEQAGDGTLIFEDDRGRGRPVTGTYLGQLLADERTLQLAVLNACEGARAGVEDPFAGVAASLVRSEIPSVIAMQFEITDDAAILFAGGFYSALARGEPVDAALAAARKTIWAAYNDIEWGTPVLFMRVPDGRVFDVAVRTDVDDDVPEADVAALAVAVSAKPAVVDRGGEVVWSLDVENSGGVELSEVSALGPDGAVLLEPCDLAPGRSARSSWRTQPTADVELAVTVSALDPGGERVTEQATGHISVRGEPEPWFRRLQVRYLIALLGLVAVAVVVAVIVATRDGDDEAGLPPGGGESYPAVVAADSPALYWRLGEADGSTAADRSGSGRGGAYQNVTLGEEGILPGDSAAGFDSASFIRQRGPAVALANSSFTIEFWARHTGHGEQHHIFSQGLPRTDAGLQLGFRNDDRFFCGFYKDDLNTTSAYPDEEWHHWACSHDVGTLARTIYRDGEIVAPGTTPAAASYRGSGPITLGQDGLGPSGFVGTIDELAVYTSVLPPEQIQAHYEAGSR